MKEIWLASNKRAFAMVLVFPLLMAAAAGLAFYLLETVHWRVVAGLISCFSLLAICSLLYLASQPRIAFRNAELLLYLGSPAGQRVPIEYVEVFFRGQAASMIAGRSEQQIADGPETSTVVVRIAERALDWHQRPVKTMLGQWCGGYITVRGTWCEPITAELIQRLNHRLVDVQRELAGAEEDQP
jgi:hypothetical protein